MGHWQTHQFVIECGGIFDRSTASSGDRALLDTLDKVIKTNIEALRTSRPDLELEQVKFIITGGENKSAFAFQDGADRAILFDIGLLRWFWERAVVVVHLPDVLSEYLPFSSNEPIVWLAPHIDSVPAANSWPIPDERKDYCIEIFQHMLEYLVVHELAHHMRGHLEIIDGDKNFVALSETTARRMGWPHAAQIVSFHLQDLELDADAHGLDLAIAALEGKYPCDQFNWEFDTISETLFLMLFSQMLVAQLFDIKEKNTGDYPLTEHPAPVYRSINFSNLACRTFYTMAGGEWDDYKQIHDSAWSEAGHVAKFFDFPYDRWHGDKQRILATKHYREAERRYFAVTELVDQIIDQENIGI